MSSTSIGMTSNHGQRNWTFDHIFGPETSQEGFFTGVPALLRVHGVTLYVPVLV